MKELIASIGLVIIVSAFTTGDTASMTKKADKPLQEVLTTDEILQKTELYKRTEHIENTLDSLGYAG